MKRNLIWMSTALVLGAAGVMAAADDLPKGETILDKYVEATGGKAAYAKIHTEISTGTMSLGAMGIKGQVTAYQAEPNKQLVEVNIEGIGKVLEGTNGEVAWGLSAMQGPRIKEGEEKAKSLESARLNGEAQWRDLYKSAETTGVEAIDGKDCYKVVLTPKSGGSPVTKWYDKESNLLVKTTATLKTAMGEIQSESVTSDFRKEGDILVPHKTVSRAMGQEFTITIDSVKHNAEIPKDKFDLPEEIQALLKKK
jgi:zinc protease